MNGDATMIRPRVFADFQKLDDFGRLILITIGSHHDFLKLGSQLRSGMEVVFYRDDLKETARTTISRLMAPCYMIKRLGTGWEFMTVPVFGMHPIGSLGRMNSGQASRLCCLSSAEL